METCFLNIAVLVRLSLLVVVLRPLSVWTYTSSSKTMDRELVTTGYFSPSITNSEKRTAITVSPKDLFTAPGTATDLWELSSPLTGTDIHPRVRLSDETDIPRLSEGELATEQSMHLSTDSTGWTLEGTRGSSTEQMRSDVVVSTEATTKWKDETIPMPELLPEAYHGLPAELRAVAQTKRSVEYRSLSVTEARLSQDSTDHEGSLRQDRSIDKSTVVLRQNQSTDNNTLGQENSTDNDTVGLRDDQSTHRGTVGLGDDQSTHRGTVGLGDDQSTNRGTVGLRDDQSTHRGTVGLGDDQSTNRGTVGLRDDQSTHSGTVGLRDDQSTHRGTVGLGDDQSTNRGTVGLRDDQSTHRGTVGLGDDQSTNRGTVGLRDDQSTHSGTVGLRDDQSTHRGTVGLRDDQSTHRGTVGLRDDQSTNRGTVGLRDDQSTHRGTVGLRDDQSSDNGTVGLRDDQSTDSGTVGLRDDQSTHRGTVGLRDDQSSDNGTVGLGDDQSTDSGTVGLRDDQSTDSGTVGFRDDQSTDSGTVGFRDDQSTDSGTVGLRDDQSTDNGTVGLRDDQSTHRGTVFLRDDQSTDSGTVGLRDDQSTDSGTVGFRDDQSSDSGTVGLRDDQSTDSGTVGLRDDQSTDSGTVGQDSLTELGTSTVSRAGERTLMSVTFNSTSMYTEDFNSSSQASTWGSSADHAGPTDITERIPSTGLDKTDATSDSHNSTNTISSKGRQPSETQWPDAFSSRTHPLTGPLNVTEQRDLTSLGSEGPPSSTPPLSRYRTTDTTDSSQPPGGRTSQAEDGMSASSQTPVVSSEEVPSRPSTTNQGEDRDLTSVLVTSPGTTNSPTGPLTTQGDQGETEGVPSVHTEDTTSVGPGLTSASPTLRGQATTLDDSLSRFLSGQPPFIPETEQPAVATEVVVSTVPITVTMTPQVTEEDINGVTTATSTTPTTPLATTRMVQPSTTTSSKAQTPPTSIPTTTTTLYTTLGLQTSTPQLPSTQQTQQTHTQNPSTQVSSTDVTTLHLETSTAIPGITTVHSGQAPTPTTATTASSYTQSATFRSTVEQHSSSTDRETAVIQVTTTPMDIRSTWQTQVKACEPNPCLNGGGCVTHEGTAFTCYCLPAWTGPTCNEDVNECESGPGTSGPCPSDSTCVNSRGSFSCECPLGLDMENGRDCTRAKTFLGTFSVNYPSHDVTLAGNLHEIQREINQLLNASLSILRGYRRSTLSKRGEDGVNISAVNMFSISTDVTSSEVYHNIQMSLNNCTSPAGHCRVVVTHQLSYHVESLCLARNTQCQPERSFCTDSNGTAYCQCQPGYFKLNPEDHSCIECGDGLKWVNRTCVRCTFGFGGFNCGNFYKLIAVVVSPAILLILVIALIVTCCKKDKNDINKIIFKSGDFQMSPYGEFPKSNRVSTEWGRETIEMQENGSTKNLLQMTDIYYSPALRNSDLERNGLYPFSGLPGSRHSCIYPAQWNPSFLSDDSRRRDYF
ncbi:hypothetical protein DPEC_G00047970 [Dallia pectoralis]|uniref:Uncharacterized protein n=1 Tax=Dallia pectoralis TaxID=75939 RepID=A0ACC2HAX7_DALPE|nr:hypothetical protein DPEC_G00047970 [Dallia pectoralis]